MNRLKQQAKYTDYKVKLKQQSGCTITGCTGSSACVIRYANYVEQKDVKRGALFCDNCSCGITK